MAGHERARLLSMKNLFILCWMVFKKITFLCYDWRHLAEIDSSTMLTDLCVSSTGQTLGAGDPSVTQWRET